MSVMYKKLMGNYGGLMYADKVKRIMGGDLIGYWPGWEPISSQPNYLAFNGVDTVVDCGSDASLDDLHDAEFTVDCWVKIPTFVAANGVVIGSFSTVGNTGWMLYYGITSNKFFFRVASGTGGNEVYVQCQSADVIKGAWMHVTGYFDDAGDRRAYIALDGVWGLPSAVMVDAIGSDAADTKYIGRQTSGGTWLTGSVGWIRISNNDRLGHGVDFTAPARTVIPTVDANTVSLWPVNEGYGDQLGDLGPNDNDGTISNGSWETYPGADNYQGNPDRDGTYHGPTLGQPGIGDGRTCPFYDGVNDYLDIKTASLEAALNRTAGTIHFWVNAAAASHWTAADANPRRLFNLQFATSAHVIQFYKIASTNILRFLYQSDVNAVNVDIDPSGYGTGWKHLAMTWDTAADEIRAYVDGQQAGATQNGLVEPVGNLTCAVVGARNTTPEHLWNGCFAHPFIATRAATPAEIHEMARVP